jgi:hypothetical protein
MNSLHRLTWTTHATGAVGDHAELTARWEAEARAYGYEPRAAPDITVTEDFFSQRKEATVVGPVRCINHRKHQGGIIQAVEGGPRP